MPRSTLLDRRLESGVGLKSWRSIRRPIVCKHASRECPPILIMCLGTEVGRVGKAVAESVTLGLVCACRCVLESSRTSTSAYILNKVERNIGLGQNVSVRECILMQGSSMDSTIASERYGIYLQLHLCLHHSECRNE